MRSLIPPSLFLTALPLLGCNAFEERPPDGPRTVRVIPTDERTAETAEVAPLPVAGGTLLNLNAGTNVVVSDPARDKITVTGRDGTLLGDLSFDAGSQPWRMAQIEARAFVVTLRGSGEVAAVDAAGTPTERWRASACSAPRGVDFELETGMVHVACAGGDLVSLDVDTGEEVNRRFLDTDLRDVVANDGQLYVSRFRSAEVLVVNDDVLSRVSLPKVQVQGFFSEDEGRIMVPEVAWRMQALQSGGVVVSHQRADVDPVSLEVGGDGDEDGSGGQVSGAAASPYGGGAAACAGIVQAAISHVSTDGKASTSPSLSGVVLPVDMAVSPDGNQVAIADSGIRDMAAPLSSVVTIDEFGESGASAAATSGVSVSLFGLHDMVPATPEDDVTHVGCVGGSPVMAGDPVSAVTFSGQGVVAFEVRTTRLRNSQQSFNFSMGGGSMVDTGHDLFHRDSGAGISCASCHPEGADDGHVWNFVGFGPRRTQNLAVPLAETAPFHWDGELVSVAHLMDDVFVDRMGGTYQSPERLERLENWLFTAPQRVTVGELDEAALRGKELFESASVGCSSCHRGDAFSDNVSYDVGTSDGLPLQTPSLIGVGSHPPYMHDGCAKTLEERFDPSCGGGDSHGHTSELSEAEVGDLVSYLRSL